MAQVRILIKFNGTVHFYLSLIPLEICRLYYLIYPSVFAYGQTGCGKSFSMQGIPDPPEQLGIIPRAFEHIFDAIDVDDKDTTYLVQASYLEIYNEEIRDLLG